MTWPGLTRPGGYALLLVVVLTAAGVASLHNNVLLLTASVVLGALLVGLPAAWLNLHRITVQVRVSPQAHAGRPFPVHLQALNGKRWWPSYWLTATLDGPRLETAVGGVWGHLPAGGGAALQLALQPLRRGLLSGLRLRLATAFPLGAWQLSRTAHIHTQILVFPRLLESEEYALSMVFTQTGRSGQRDEDQAELDNLREYQPGDPPRRIHWPTSARQGRLMVTESFTAPVRRLWVRLVVLPGCSEDSYEQAISLAATACRKAGMQGHEFGLTAGAEGVPMGQGEGHLTRAMTLLALLPEWAPERAWTQSGNWTPEAPGLLIEARTQKAVASLQSSHVAGARWG